ncbi:RecX family transcriptional regulator [Flavobacterium silvisoli]|uniref:Regulatory protein RecX n=1 Tax=Flavobacterium silvisoli TaxID=2529433 RepID=A0A4Q9Z2V8_9FLAO|nr:RecX family transcriptional regulator [Flavobacterium silvisoli]TBX70723.1 RecX family transcriptional regulator [Flavobacterium silvisoli]
MSEKISFTEALKKLEHYCAYQERCHQEVASKLKQLGIQKPEDDLLIVSLIENNFLNEERFARSFARGKHRIKFWGHNRIITELKARHISATNIKLALTEISNEEYTETFEKIAEKTWDSITEKNQLKKRKKFCDYLLRKGWESDWVYEKVKQLEKE